MFLTQDDVVVGGGELGNHRVDYFSTVTNQVESLEVGPQVLDVLPKQCPELFYDSCALVGNSGTLQLDDFGGFIDGHDMVYRFNQAPTVNFENHVGRKTTHESLNAKFAHQLAKGEEGWLWREPGTQYVMFEPMKLLDSFSTLRHAYSDKQFLMMSPEMFVRIHGVYDFLLNRLEEYEFGCFLGEKPMSGFYALMMGLTVCKHIDMIGFDPWVDSMSNGHNQVRYHYFDTEEPRPGAHSFDATYLMYQLLELAGYEVTIKAISVDESHDWSAKEHHTVVEAESTKAVEIEIGEDAIER